jgi:hypothetical protein
MLATWLVASEAAGFAAMDFMVATLDTDSRSERA